MNSFDARIEAQLRRTGRSHDELQQKDPLFGANAMAAFAEKFNLVLDALESVLNERDALVNVICASGNKCEICKYKQDTDKCVESDFMCVCCRVDCMCKKCDTDDNFEYAVATGCEKEQTQ